MKISAFINDKGGVGKTTLAIHVAGILADRGKRVLVVDADPSGALSRWAGWRFGSKAESEVPGRVWLGEAELGEALFESPFGFALLPAGEGLAFAERELQGDIGGHTTLARLLEGGPWDAVVIDAPPGGTFFAGAALCAAEDVVVPYDPSALAMQGLGRTLTFVQRKRAQRVTTARVAVVVANQVERTKSSVAAIESGQTAAESVGAAFRRVPKASAFRDATLQGALVSSGSLRLVLGELAGLLEEGA